MKIFTLALIGSLGVLSTACQIDVDDYCDDGHDGDDDDDRPCETHIHADTNTSGVGGSAGASASGGNPGAGGSSSDGGSGAGSGGSSAGATTGSQTGGDSSAGGTAATSTSSSGAAGTGTGGGSSANGASTTGVGGAGCTNCEEPAEPAACLWGSITRDACCSAEVLVDAAADDCEAYGLELADVTLEEACDGGHHQVGYQCCRESAAYCSTQAITLDACASEQTLASLAEQLCADMGLVASELLTGDPCGDDSYSSVSATCCASD